MSASATAFDLCCLLLLAPPSTLSCPPNPAHTVIPAPGVKDSQHIVHAPKKQHGLSAYPSCASLVSKTLFICVVLPILSLDLTSIPEVPGHWITGDTRPQIYTSVLAVNESPATHSHLCSPGLS